MESVFVMFLLTLALRLSDADCNIVPMTQWAGEPSRRTETLHNPVDLVIIQHSVTEEVATDEECVNTVQAVRQYYMQRLGYDDIPHSFYICGNGRVYEGAGWSLVGAHTRGYNTKSIGICFIGNFDSKLPSSQALNATLDLMSCGVENSHLTKEYEVVSHRQVSHTRSPGDSLHKEIQSWPHWANGTKTLK